MVRVPLARRVFLLLGLSLGSPLSASVPDIEATVAAIQTSALRADRAFEVREARIETGVGRLLLEQGLVFPAVSTAGDDVPELVFLGRGRFELTAPNDIEAAQLEMYSRQRSLAEPFDAAVLVVPRESWRGALLAGRPRTATPADFERAKGLLAGWRSQRERQLLGLELQLVRDRLGEPALEEYFAASLTTSALGPLLYVVDRETEDAALLGRFERPELTAEEREAVVKTLHHEQRRGRLVGLRDEDLGHWDTWLSSPLPDAVGQPPFAARAYRMSVRLSGAQLRLTGRVRIDVEALYGGHRGVVLTLHEAAQVTAARDETGAALPFVTRHGRTLVVLPTAPAAGTRRTLEIDWHGPLLEADAEATSWALIDSTGWYPQTPETGPATFDIAFVWPERLEVVAPGRASAGTATAGEKSRRFTVDRPTFAFNFQVGKYRQLRAEAGDLVLELYLDDSFAAVPLNTWPKLLLHSAAQSALFLHERLGAPPEKRVALVTAPAGFSQSFLGMIVVEAALLRDSTGRDVDPRAVLAHELAHQWWGHRVDSTSYRDQWIHEALATYFALAFIKERESQGDRFGASLIDDWDETLESELADGRPLESVGPLVLGGRLESSRARGAYASIVYLKGALVFSTLAELFGAERLETALRQVLGEFSGAPLTTDALVASLGRHLAQDLEPFADAYIRATGLPEVTYDYRVTKAAELGWQVEGTARWAPPYHYRYRLSERPQGLPDLIREGVVGHAPVGELAVPVEVGVLDEAERRDQLDGLFGITRMEREAVISNRGTSTREQRVRLSAGETAFRMKLDREPRRVVFSPRGEVLAVFENLVSFPKWGLVTRAQRLDAEGRREEALALYQQALGARLYGGQELQNEGFRDLVAQGRDFSDLGIQLAAARLALDLGRTDDAEVRLNAAELAAQTESRVWFEEEVNLLRARLALQRGRPRTALRYLERIAKEVRLEGIEALGLHAVALWADQRTAELAPALERAARAGLDVALLRSKSPPPKSEKVR